MKKPVMSKPDLISAIRHFQSSTFLLIIFLLGGALYSNTFSVQMDLDDWLYVGHNPAVSDFRYFYTPSLSERAIAEDRLNDNFRTRKFVVFTFALNHWFHDDRVFGYHMVNLLIHLCSGILVYWLVLSTLRTPFFTADGRKEEFERAGPVMALFAALFFVAHPVQTQAITYISQRFTSMTTMLYLLSLVLYIRWRLTGVTRKALSERGERQPFGVTRHFLYGMAIVTAFLAMFSKEIAFTLPVMIILYEWMFFGRPTLRQSLRFLPFIGTMLIIPVIVIAHRGSYEDMAVLTSSLEQEGPNHVLIYLFTEFRVIITYFRLLLLPVNQNLDYDYPHYSSFFQAPVFVSFSFLCIVAGLAIYLLRLSTRLPKDQGRWYRLISFGIGWFFITLSIESSFIPLGDVIFEHRLYLPSIGFFLSFVGVIALVLSRFRSCLWIVVIILTLVLGMLSAATYARNMIWRSSVSLWEDTVRKSPDKFRAQDNLGRAYIQEKRFAEGIPHMQNALRMFPNNDDPLFYSLFGAALSGVNRFDEAIAMHKKATELDPYDPQNHYHLGNAYLGTSDLVQAESAFRNALSIQPDLAKAHGNLGLLLMQQGNYSAAEPHLESLLQLAPQSVDANQILGELRALQGHIDEAVKLYREALRLSPDDTNLRIRLQDLVLLQNPPLEQ